MKKFSINGQSFTLAQILEANPDEREMISAALDRLEVGESWNDGNGGENITRQHDWTMEFFVWNGGICSAGHVFQSARKACNGADDYVNKIKRLTAQDGNITLKRFGTIKYIGNIYAQ